MHFFKKKSRRTAPRPRLLPPDAYPDDVDENARDRVDEFLRERLHTIPVLPGEYLDNQGEPWTLWADGSWTDQDGVTRSSLYAPILSAFGPFTSVAPAATEGRCLADG